eukprot:356150-Rhodomonas_salina.1
MTQSDPSLTRSWSQMSLMTQSSGSFSGNHRFQSIIDLSRSSTDRTKTEVRSESQKRATPDTPAQF